MKRSWAPIGLRLARPTVVVMGLTAAFAGSIGCNRTPENPPPRCDEKICTVDEDGVLHTVVDATDRDNWISFDFETAGQVDVAEDEAADSAAWDIGFRRMVVRSNSGVNGTGNVEVCIVEGANFDELTVAPVCDWIDDKDSRLDPRDPGGTVFNEDAWYDYDLIEHTLHAKDRVYAVRTVEGIFFKMQFLDYYSVDDIAAWPSFQWASLAPF